MTTSVKLRAGAGRDLTWSEVDQNFSGLADAANTNAESIATLNEEVAALAAGSVPAPEVFVAGIGFIPGTSTTITTARAYGSVSNIDVHFDGVFQGPDQVASVSGNTVTFNSIIPVGVSTVYIRGGTVQSVGVPPAQSVGVPQLGLDAKAYFVKTADLAASSGAGLVGGIQAGLGSITRTQQDKTRELVTAKDFGAIGDGSTHPLSERYATITAAQTAYPFVTALTQEIDWAAGQAAINYCASYATLSFSAGIARAAPYYFAENNRTLVFGDLMLQLGDDQLSVTGDGLNIDARGTVFNYTGNAGALRFYKFAFSNWLGGEVQVFNDTASIRGMHLDGACRFNTFKDVKLFYMMPVVGVSRPGTGSQNQAIYINAGVVGSDPAVVFTRDCIYNHFENVRGSGFGWFAKLLNECDNSIGGAVLGQNVFNAPIMHCRNHLWLVGVKGNSFNSAVLESADATVISLRLKNNGVSSTSNNVIDVLWFESPAASTITYDIDANCIDNHISCKQDTFANFGAVAEIGVNQNLRTTKIWSRIVNATSLLLDSLGNLVLSNISGKSTITTAAGAMKLLAGAGVDDFIEINPTGQVTLKTASAVNVLRFVDTTGQARIKHDNSSTIFSATSSDTETLRIGSTGIVTPGTDNMQTLGSAGNRWSVVYAGTGAINTSDAREKQQIRPIDAAVLRAWSKVDYCQYKFNDAVAKKGDGARWHFGVVAQRVKESFESEGLDPFAYGVLGYDEWDEQPEIINEQGQIEQHYRAASNRYGIRYEEALVIECAYLRSRLIN